jgi:hypothetical protein
MNSLSAPPSVLEWFYGVLFRPRETFALEALPQALGAGLWAIALAALFGTLTFGAPGTAWLPLAFGVTFAWDVVGWLAISCLLYLVTRLFTGQGELKAFLASTALAGLPWLFLAPFYGLRAWGTGGQWLAALAISALFLWWAWLVLKAVGGSTGLGLGRSFAAVVIAIGLVAALPFVLGTLGILGAWLCWMGSV